MSISTINNKYVACLEWADAVESESGSGDDPPNAAQVQAQTTEMKRRQQKCLTYLLYKYAGSEDFVKKPSEIPSITWPHLVE